MYVIEKPKDEIYCCYFDRFHLRLIIKRVAENEKEFIIFLAKKYVSNNYLFFQFGILEIHASKKTWRK